MRDRRTTRLVYALADPETRAGAAWALAKRLGGVAVLVLIRDPEVAALVPAPGFPATLPGGPAWRDLLGRCAAVGTHHSVVPFPDEATRVRATACVIRDGTTLVLLRPRARPTRLAGVCSALVPVAVALRAQQHAHSLGAELAIARNAEIEARSLSASLENARRELTRALGEKDARSRALEQAARDKDDFLAMLGHELRNPLAPITLALHLVPMKRKAGQPIDHELAILARQSAQLARIVDDLLEVSRITRGKIELRREPTTLDAAVARAVEAARPLVDARRHALTVSLPDAPVSLDADPARLVQIFANVLNNAAKYTDPGGHIDVRARVIEDRVEVRVTDDGIGIPAEVLPRIFDVFVQAPRALDRSEGGLGLGLPLVRGLVELHGGEVTATSAGRGRGTEVVVRLPLGPPAALPVVTSPPPPSAAGAARVLVVEDNADAASMLEALLGSWGCEVRVARDGEQAMRVARAFQPDTIVLDIGLPGMSGYDVARWAHERLPGARLIALTGYCSPSDRESARAAGVEHHLAKPVDPESLRVVLGSR